MMKNSQNPIKVCQNLTKISSKERGLFCKWLLSGLLMGIFGVGGTSYETIKSYGNSFYARGSWTMIINHRDRSERDFQIINAIIFF